jgi:glucose-6-phosphate dehydrogenase assembly protein OpcA
MNNLTIGNSVALRDIEKTLSSLWQESADKEAGKPVIRASTINFIVLSHHPDQVESINKVVSEISDHHPSRIIVALVDPESDTGDISARVSLQCNLNAAMNKQICFEQVVLSTGTEGFYKLSGVILPLLLPDLPVFLWMADNQFDLIDKLQPLHSAIDRLLIESPGMVEDWSAFQDYRQKLLEINETMGISDLHWGYLTEWREAVAQFFDQPSRREWLDNIREMTIHQKQAGISTDGLFLVAWIASRLGWTLKSVSDHKEFQLTFVNPKREVEVHFIRDGKDPLNRVLVHSDSEERSVLFKTELKDDHLMVQVQQGERGIEQGLLSAPSGELGALVCHELDLLKKDRIYLAMLEILESHHE